MLLSDVNGSKSKALEYFSRKFFDGVGESARFFRQMLQKRNKMNMGVGNGDTFTINVIGDLPRVTAAAVEGATTNVSTFSITKVSVTVLEYRDKIVYSDKLKAMSELPLEDIFKNKLGRQAAESLDQIAHDLVFATANVVASPKTGALTTNLDFATNGTAVTANAGTQLTLAHVLKIASYMKQNRWPQMDGKYYAIGTPEQLAAIKQELTQINQHTETGFLRFVQGVVGEIYGIVFIEQNNVDTQDIYFFGENPGMEVVVKPENIYIGTELDIGTKLEIGWKALLGYSKMMDNRIVRFAGAPKA